MTADILSLIAGAFRDDKVKGGMRWNPDLSDARSAAELEPRQDQEAA